MPKPEIEIDFPDVPDGYFWEVKPGLSWSPYGIWLKRKIFGGLFSKKIGGRSAYRREQFIDAAKEILADTIDKRGETSVYGKYYPKKDG